MLGPQIDNRPVGLVTSHTPRMPKLWRVRCGTQSETDTGVPYPDKLRNPKTKEFYFHITRPGAKTDKGHIPMDPDMQKAAEEATKSKHPMWLPIFVLSNSLAEVMNPQERAVFQGRRRWCYCDKLWPKTREQAEADDLPWLSVWADDPNDAHKRGLPWPPPDTLGQEAYYHGFFTANDAWGPSVDALSTASRSCEGRPVCDPSTCLIALGTHGILNKRKEPAFTCKPHIVINFRFNTDVIKLPHGAPPWAYVSTTGWNTHGAMTGTWERIVQDYFPEGSLPWVMGLPLRLRLGTEDRVTRKGTTQKIPVWSLEPHGNEDEILAVLEARSARKVRIQAQLAEGVSLLKALPASTDYQDVFAREFHPESVDTEPAWLKEARTLGVQLQMSEGCLASQVANVEADNETPDAFLARLREQVAHEESADPEPVDDEPIDVEAESAVDEEPEVPAEVTAADLKAYAEAENVPADVQAHLAKGADQGHFAKGSAERRAFLMSEMVTWVGRRDAGEANAESEGDYEDV